MPLLSARASVCFLRMKWGFGGASTNEWGYCLSFDHPIVINNPTVKAHSRGPSFGGATWRSRRRAESSPRGGKNASAWYQDRYLLRVQDSNCSNTTFKEQRLWWSLGSMRILGSPAYVWFIHCHWSVGEKKTSFDLSVRPPFSLLRRGQGGAINAVCGKREEKSDCLLHPQNLPIKSITECSHQISFQHGYWTLCSSFQYWLRENDIRSA